MRIVLILLASLLLLTACASQQPATLARHAAQAPTAQNVILILAPQGVDPAHDSVGFNTLVADVTQSFAVKLANALAANHHATVDVLDQSPEYDIQQKLAMWSARKQAKTAIVLTLVTDTVGNDDRLSLGVQYVEQDFIMDGDHIRGVKPVTVLDKSYLLKSSVTGPYKGTVTDMANDFTAYLKAQGRL